jgi:hypothetical protein
MKMQKISAFLLSFLFVSVLSASIITATSVIWTTKNVKFQGNNVKDTVINTLTGTYKRTTFSAPVAFNLSNFKTNAIGISGNLRQITNGKQSKISGSIVLFAKGLDTDVGTTHYLDSSTKSNVKLNVVATFNPTKSGCSSFTSENITCTTSLSRVYMFIPSHEDLKFFDEHPKNLTIMIVKDTLSSSRTIKLYAGNNAAGNNILNITNINVTSFSFKPQV